MSSHLFDVRKTKKINLPSYPDVEIELYDQLLTSDVGKLSNNTTDYDRGIEVLRCLIKSWSFVNEKEEPLTISKENLEKLPTKDFTFLMKEAAEALSFLEIKQKKS
ncbi:MAG: hypothetical protein WC438_06040 [Candidatus Pacearchaeota archaeon]